MNKRKSSIIRAMPHQEKQPAKHVPVDSELTTEAISEPINESNNEPVRNFLFKKYKLGSPNDLSRLAIRQENGRFVRGVYKVRKPNQGEIIVKVLKMDEDEARLYHKNLHRTHLPWSQDTKLGKYILKIFPRDEPDYNKTQQLLCIEFEVARETLTNRIAKKEQYSEEQRIKDLNALIDALSLLHSRDTQLGRNFHGDLKPDNIFFVDHKNADGPIVECLKIGDIEDSAGTRPYRDLTGFSLKQDFLNLSASEEKDDLMAIKMIILEMAYDFCLFDLCEPMTIEQFKGFLIQSPYRRQQFIKTKISTNPYFKHIPIDMLMKRDRLESGCLQKVITEKTEIDLYQMSKKYKPIDVCRGLCRNNPDAGCQHLSQGAIETVDQLKRFMEHWRQSLKKYSCSHIQTLSQLETELEQFYIIYRYLAQFETDIPNSIKIERQLENALQNIEIQAEQVPDIDINQLPILKSEERGAHTKKAIKRLSAALSLLSGRNPQAGTHLDEILGMDSPWDAHWKLSTIYRSPYSGDKSFIKKVISYMHLKSHQTSGDLIHCLYVLEKCGNDPNEIAFTELDHLIRFQHPNVLELKSIFKRTPQLTAFSTEKMDGNLSFSKKSPQQNSMAALLTPWGLAQDLLNNLFSAITYIHSHGFTHNDLNAKNILYKDYGEGSFNFKICDFGKVDAFNEARGKEDLEGFWRMVQAFATDMKGDDLESSVVEGMVEELSTFIPKYEALDYVQLKAHICHSIASLKALLPENSMHLYPEKSLDSYTKGATDEIQIVVPVERELKRLFIDPDNFVSLEELKKMPDGNKPTTISQLKKYFGGPSNKETSKKKLFFGLFERKKL